MQTRNPVSKFTPSSVVLVGTNFQTEPSGHVKGTPGLTLTGKLLYDVIVTLPPLRREGNGPGANRGLNFFSYFSAAGSFI